MPTLDHAVIAAAGFGSRLGRGHPKCLLDVAGRTLLQRQLELLRDVPDVRVVVGFEEDTVIALARRLRPDITIVRNPAFASTTALNSYALGARYLSRPCLFMDADIIFEPASFAAFLAQPGEGPLVGYTHTKTQDPVHVAVSGGRVTGFSRTEQVETEQGQYEWANVLRLPGGYLDQPVASLGDSPAVFERLSVDLPLPGRYVESYEIDRPADLDVALAFLAAQAAGIPTQRVGELAPALD